MITDLKIIVIALSTLMASAGQQDLPPQPTVFYPIIPQPQPPPKGLYSSNPASKNLPYRSISLHRRGAAEAGESYDVTFHSDCTAEFISLRGLNETGSFIGGVSLSTYSRLCSLVDQINFRKLKPKYLSKATDQVTITISLQTNDEIISVSDYGNASPIEFWAIEQVLENLRRESSWWRISPHTRKP